MSIDSVAGPVVVSLAGRSTGRSGDCRPDPRTRDHHDRLLRVEDDPDELVDLLELAVTWGELDYSESDVLPPEVWTEFAERHRWRHADRVRRLFSLAADIALRGGDPPAAPVPAPCRGADGARTALSAAELLAGEL